MSCSPSNGKQAVVLLSGGLDSSTLLHHVRRQGYAPLFALTFHYGQRHAREIECAVWQARAAGVAEHRRIAMGFFGDLIQGGSALTDPAVPVPDGRDLTDAQRDQPPTYVPNRNMILLSLAAAYAEARGATDVFYGAQTQDRYGYWDCTAEFVERLNAALALNRRQAVTIHAPFVAWRKAAIVRAGLELGVDYARTWTCYRGVEPACGTCPACVERRDAFREAGREDPLPYGVP